MAKIKKITKPKYDPEFFHKDGFPKLPAFLDRLLQKNNDKPSKKTPK